MASTRRPLAVVLDGPQTPAWQERALQGMVRSEALEVVAVRRLSTHPGARVRRLLAALERHVFRAGADALAPANVPAGSSYAPGAGDSEAGLCVWLAERQAPPLGQPGRPGGLMYLRHGGLVEGAQDAMMRAALAGESVVESEVVLTRGDAAVVVERGVSAVRTFSPTVSASLALWKLAVAVPRAAERQPGLDLPTVVRGEVGRPPPLMAVLWHALATWPRALLIHLLYRRPWLIRVRERAQGEGPDEARQERSLRTRDDWNERRALVRWRRGHLYADPFLFEHEGSHHLFCEEVPAGAGRGVISHTLLPADGAPAPAPSPVLELPHHTSYPFVFEHEGSIFMIPETNASRRVELYRAVDFPRQWRREATLIDDLSASDATLLRHDELLWLLVGAAPPDASTLDELHVFWARELTGPWHPHPRNPVVADVRCARPAGAVQRWGSRLIRPAQDCSRRYGWAVSLREIDLLSASEYAEHEVGRLEPSDLGTGARATHTYAADGRFEAVDLRTRELRLGLALARMRSRWAGSRESQAGPVGASRQLEM